MNFNMNARGFQNYRKTIIVNKRRRSKRRARNPKDVNSEAIFSPSFLLMLDHMVRKIQAGNVTKSSLILLPSPNNLLSKK